MTNPPPPASHAPVKGFVEVSDFTRFNEKPFATIYVSKTNPTGRVPVLVLSLDASGHVGEALVDQVTDATLRWYNRALHPDTVRRVLSALVSAATTETGT